MKAFRRRGARQGFLRPPGGRHIDLSAARFDGIFARVTAASGRWKGISLGKVTGRFKKLFGASRGIAVRERVSGPRSVRKMRNPDPRCDTHRHATDNPSRSESTATVARAAGRAP